MKKIINILMVLCLLLTSCSIDKNPVNEKEAKFTEITKNDNDITEPLLSKPLTTFYTYKTEDDFPSEDYYPYGGPSEDYLKYTMYFYGAQAFKDLVDENVYNEWNEQFDFYGSGERNSYECNLYTFVTELNIPKEEFAKFNSDRGSFWSDAHIDALYSNDTKALNQAFGNKNALILGEKIFTPDLLATFTQKDYKENGITAEMLEDYVKRIDITDFSHILPFIASTLKEMNPTFDYNDIKCMKNMTYIPSFYGISDSMRYLVSEKDYKEWVNQFRSVENGGEGRSIHQFNFVNMANELGLIRKQKITNTESPLIDRAITDVITTSQINAIISGNLTEIASAFSINNMFNDCYVEKNGVIYDFEWLSTSYVEAYIESGIGTSDMEPFMNVIYDNMYLKSCEWVQSCYYILANME